MTSCRCSNDINCEILIGVFNPCTTATGGYLENLMSSRLKRNGLSSEGSQQLVAAIREGAVSNLKRLNLRANDLGPKGVIHLSCAFRDGFLPFLAMLDLGHNGLGCEGMIALAEAMEKGRPSKTCLHNQLHSWWQMV